MNYLAPGLRELARIADRLVCRGQLVWQRRQLAQLESKLGLLGWQQADYDTGTQQHVDRIADVERAQGQLTNESAALGLALQQLEERRTAERTTFETQRAERLAAREPLAGPVAESERVLNARQRERKEIEERIATLEREKVTGEEKYRALLVKGSSNPTEVERWQRRVIAIPREQQEWREKLAAMQAELPGLESEWGRHRSRLAAEIEAMRALEKSFADSDAALAGEIAARKRDKQKLERQIDGLEKTKTQPYREIGKALADQSIEPLNQPQALTDVLAQRERIAAQESRVAVSREKSRREKRVEVWGAWVLLLTIVVVLWIAMWFIVSGR